MAFGNISSYAAAGRSVSGAHSQLFATQRGRTDPDAILKAALEAQAEEKLNVMQIKGKLDKAAINVKSNLASQAIQAEADSRISGTKAKTQKMAGVVASLAPVAKMFENKRKRPRAPVNVDYSDLITDANTRLSKAQTDLANFKPTTLKTATPDSAEPNTLSLSQPIEYLSGDPKHTTSYRADHGGANYHDHLAFNTTEQRDQAMQILRDNNIKIGSINDGEHAPNSYHYADLAFDVPGTNWAVGEEAAGSALVRRLLGIK